MADPALRISIYPLITDVDVSRMSTQVSIYNDEITGLSSTNGATTVDFFNTTIETIEATIEIFDVEMGKMPEYLTVGKTPL